MTTNDELRAMIERQDQLMMKLRVCLDINIPATTIELDAWATDAAAMLRAILAEREREPLPRDTNRFKYLAPEDPCLIPDDLRAPVEIVHSFRHLNGEDN